MKLRYSLLLLICAPLLTAQDLTIGLMPAVDSIPLLIAEEQGFFEAEGITVELRMFRNQLYRETALQTNDIDGSVSDLINAVYNWRNGTGTRVLSVTDGHFSLVSRPGSPIGDAASWNRASQVRVGLLENSIIYYVAERMLDAAGADPGRIELVTTMQVPTRMEMLLAGQLETAVLPEPVARVAVERGATVVVDSSLLDQTPGVLLFTRDALEKKGESIRALYRAYNRAVELLNSDPERYRSDIVRLGEFPPVVESSMVIPDYQRARAPTREELAEVTAWMTSKGLLEQAPTYRQIVETGVLPRE